MRDAAFKLLTLKAGDKMMSRRVLMRLRSQPMARLGGLPRLAATQIRCVSQSQAEVEDPDMNGGYINPPAQKRQHRDPYGGWWDQQDRRNFGEPVHEDNDILSTFSTEPYTHFKAPKAFFLLGCSVASVIGLSVVVSYFYPDKPTVPRTFPDGLEAELGGPNAVPARKPGEDTW